MSDPNSKGEPKIIWNDGYEPVSVPLSDLIDWDDNSHVDAPPPPVVHIDEDGNVGYKIK